MSAQPVETGDAEFLRRQQRSASVDCFFILRQPGCRATAIKEMANPQNGVVT
jgi:hypothetical protein